MFFALISFDSTEKRIIIPYLKQFKNMSEITNPKKRSDSSLFKLLDNLRIEVTHINTAVYPAATSYGPRVSKHYEFTWITHGQCSWESGGQTWSTPPGAMILSRPGMREFFSWDPKRPSRHVFFRFTIQRNGAVLPPETDWPTVLKMPEGDIIRPLFRRLALLNSSPNPESPYLSSWTARMLFISYISGLVGTGEGVPDPGISEAVNLAMLYVRNQWASGNLKSPTLQELAKASHVTPGHLCKLFHDAVGCPPLLALRRLRVHQAATMLARTKLTIKEIALAAGFESPFHFSRCFKEIYGRSPKNFRSLQSDGLMVPDVSLTRVESLAEIIWGSA
jgi:AraC family transcriptional regulator